MPCRLARVRVQRWQTSFDSWSAHRGRHLTRVTATVDCHFFFGAKASLTCFSMLL